MRSRTAGVMTTLMRNGRDRRLGKPVKGHAILERALLVGTRSADHIRASGHCGCIAMEVSPPFENRPYTWLHPNASQIRQIPPCTAGAVHTWPLTSFTAPQKCGRFSNRPLGSSAFRPSTTSTVSMSLTGSRFSSESAPRPFHDGIRERGGTIYRAALPSDEWQVQATKRTHLIHRPARDIIPPLGGARVFSYYI